MGPGNDHIAAPAAGDALPVGYRLHWYEIDKIIGRGGFGITYVGRDANLDQVVAIKEYFPRSYAERDATDSVRPIEDKFKDTYYWGLRRFLDEAQTLAKFRHPSIVRVSSVFEANGTAYIVMDYERGRSLTDVIKAGSIEDERKLLAFILPLLDGLEQVHAAGFIHRDIKPANIVIHEDGSPVLLDFGAARQALVAENGQLTTVGTQKYAPFEQLDGSGELKQGPWTDIYSLGAVLYEIVGGEPPADSLRRGSTLLEGRKDPLRPLDRGALSARYSAELLRSIEDALVFKLVDRPQSIAGWRSMYPVLDGTPGRIQRSSTGPASDSAAGKSPAAPDGGTTSPEAVTESGVTMFKSLDVMVVDDEPFARNLTVRVLRRLGVERIMTASDGAKALTELDAAASNPDVVLCDLNMPGMDGLELLRRLGERATDCAVIVVSGEDEKIMRAAESLGKAHGLEILGFLAKPLAPKPLSRLLRKIDKSRSPRPKPLGDVVSEDELREALWNGCMIPEFQPMVSVPTRKVVGVEALARLRHPQRGILGPGTFIRLAEERGRIGELTEAVLRHAVVQMGAWQADGIDLKLAVNISTNSLGDFRFFDRTISWATAEGLRPSQLVLELTESRVMRDARSTLETLSRFRLKGVGISIDDFGTGYSTLEQLRQAPFTQLKVDRQFVAGAHADPSARAILESGVSLGRRLGLEVVAEGVETREDWDLVEELGCDLAQGYFLARPMPGEEIPDWIARWSGLP